MSYPQPKADLYAKNGYSFFRLNTTLLSDGDIYETAQASNGLAIGPDSDISKVNVAYYDDQVSGYMNQVAITPGRPFPGNIEARNEATYAPSSRVGRTIIWPANLYNATWQPADFDPGQWRLDFEKPVLDVVEYFSPVGQIAGRNDKEYSYQEIAFPAPTGGFWGLVIPFYGRRYASIFFANNYITGVASADISIAAYGLTYTQASDASADHLIPNDIDLKQLLAPVTALQTTKVIKAATDGMYDALFLKFGGGPALAGNKVILHVVTSDREA